MSRNLTVTGGSDERRRWRWEMVNLRLLGVGEVEKTGSILLVLRAPEVARLLVIETGQLEGRAIALEAQGIRAERPLTQDLLFDVIQRLGAQVESVRIEEFREEAFFATLVLTPSDGAGAHIEIDARPSDAIALALRAHAPIFASEAVIAEMGLPEEPEGRFADLYIPPDEEEPDGRIVH